MSRAAAPKLYLVLGEADCDAGVWVDGRCVARKKAAYSPTIAAAQEQPPQSESLRWQDFFHRLLCDFSPRWSCRIFLPLACEQFHHENLPPLEALSGREHKALLESCLQRTFPHSPLRRYDCSPEREQEVMLQCLPWSAALHSLWQVLGERRQNVISLSGLGDLLPALPWHHSQNAQNEQACRERGEGSDQSPWRLLFMPAPDGTAPNGNHKQLTIYELLYAHGRLYFCRTLPVANMSEADDEYCQRQAAHLHNWLHSQQAMPVVHWGLSHADPAAAIAVPFHVDELLARAEKIPLTDWRPECFRRRARWLHRLRFLWPSAFMIWCVAIAVSAGAWWSDFALFSLVSPAFSPELRERLAGAEKAAKPEKSVNPAKSVASVGDSLMVSGAVPWSWLQPSLRQLHWQHDGGTAWVDFYANSGENTPDWSFLSPAQRRQLRPLAPAAAAGDSRVWRLPLSAEAGTAP